MPSTGPTSTGSTGSAPPPAEAAGTIVVPAPVVSAGPVLVTGAAGFVGAWLVEHLVAGGATVVGWRRPGTTALTGAAIRWMDVELLDRDAVERALVEVAPSSIYHLAGAAHLADSWRYPRETLEGNVLATHHLLQALSRLGQRPRVLVSGSATIYRPGSAALDEGAPLAPASPYATSKLAQEMVAAEAWREQGIAVLLARAFNHVGPRQTPAYVAPSIARQVALIERGELPPVLRMGNLDPERDIMDVRDTVRAYAAMMASGQPGVPYNVCAGRAIRIGDLVGLFLARARVGIRIEQDPSRVRASDIPRLLGNHARLSRDTGWAPEIRSNRRWTTCWPGGGPPMRRHHGCAGAADARVSARGERPQMQRRPRRPRRARRARAGATGPRAPTRPTPDRPARRLGDHATSRHPVRAGPRSEARPRSPRGDPAPGRRDERRVRPAAHHEDTDAADAHGRRRTETLWRTPPGADGRPRRPVRRGRHA